MSFFKTELSDDDSSDDENDVPDGIEIVMKELLEVKEDWFNDLSGGQKSKVELVRKVCATFALMLLLHASTLLSPCFCIL